VLKGNHDITLDRDFYAEHGAYFHNQHPQDPDKCLALFADSPNITYLSHGSRTIRLTSPTGPHTTFTIFGSPYSPATPARPPWAFTYPPASAPQLWSQIPLHTDILVTHTPAKYHLDEMRGLRAAGCEALRGALWRVRPRLFVCGHVHEARGAERVRWDLEMENVGGKEGERRAWVDPAGDKGMSLVDLTGKSGGWERLDNDGSGGRGTAESSYDSDYAYKPPNAASFTSSELFTPSSLTSIGTFPLSATSQSSLPPLPPPPTTEPTESLPPSTLGQGGIPPSGRCDNEALAGRLGRRETCIVNAAIMASSWPHKGAGGKRFNRPVVVDLELPVWGEEE
jgi:hypothetical protein